MKLIDFNVIIEDVESLNKLSAGGLVLPNNYTIPMAYGRVTKIGPGRFNDIVNKQIPINLSVGDLVIYNPGVSKPLQISTKTADGKILKKKYNKIAANECILVLNEDENGKIIGIKSVKENYVIIKRDNTDKMTVGGIYIPEINKTINNITGTVICTGPGKYDPKKDQRIPCLAKPGDKTAFIEMQAIQLSIPVKKDNGEIVTEKYYEVPDSGLDVLLTTDTEGNMNSIKKIKEGHILVQRSSGEKKTTGGIYLPELDMEGHLIEATVIMVGDNCKTGVTTGDRIIYVDAKDNNKEFKLPFQDKNGKVEMKKCFILPEKEIEVILDAEESL